MSDASEVPEALRSAEKALQRGGTDLRTTAWGLLGGVGNDGAGLVPVIALKKASGVDGDQMERLLLWTAAQESLSRVSTLPIDETVRKQLCEDLRQLHAMSGSVAVGTYEFNRAAKMATLRRFPAGPMEWEVSGIPRSKLLEASFPDNMRLLSFVTFRLGGWAPFFFMHVAPVPRNRGLSVPTQVLRAYHRIGRSLQLQPAMRGLIAEAWFHDPAAVRDHPHLEVLNRPYVEHGGLIVSLGPAPPDSGVLQGNAQRKADYLAGKIRYKYALAIWPRDAAIAWTNAHPELR